MARERVLLALANADCRKIYSSVLAFDGFVVDSASTVADVLTRIAGGHFDLIVADLYLPSSEDECLIRVLRASPATAHLPVIVLSGWTTESHRRLAMDMGAERFLPLPLRPRELSTIIGSILGEILAPSSSPPIGNDAPRPLTNGV
jgi:DNA-binding response OmpR family regulator